MASAPGWVAGLGLERTLAEGEFIRSCQGRQARLYWNVRWGGDYLFAVRGR